jgi:hypothetical protein
MYTPSMIAAASVAAALHGLDWTGKSGYSLAWLLNKLTRITAIEQVRLSTPTAASGPQSQCRSHRAIVFLLATFSVLSTASCHLLPSFSLFAAQSRYTRTLSLPVCVRARTTCPAAAKVYIRPPRNNLTSHRGPRGSIRRGFNVSLTATRSSLLIRLMR